jgi:hypothetical protein
MLTVPHSNIGNMATAEGDEAMGDEQRTIVTTMADIGDADVTARRLDVGEVMLSVVNERGTDVRLVGSRMGLLALLDDMREAVVLLDDTGDRQ